MVAEGGVAVVEGGVARHFVNFGEIVVAVGGGFVFTLVGGQPDGVAAEAAFQDGESITWEARSVQRFGEAQPDAALSVDDGVGGVEREAEGVHVGGWQVLLDDEAHGGVAAALCVGEVLDAHLVACVACSFHHLELEYTSLTRVDLVGLCVTDGLETLGCTQLMLVVEREADAGSGGGGGVLGACLHTNLGGSPEEFVDATEDGTPQFVVGTGDNGHFLVVDVDGTLAVEGANPEGLVDEGGDLHLVVLHITHLRSKIVLGVDRSAVLRVEEVVVVLCCLAVGGFVALSCLQ